MATKYIIILGGIMNTIDTIQPQSVAPSNNKNQSKGWIFFTIITLLISILIVGVISNVIFRPSTWTDLGEAELGIIILLPVLYFMIICFVIESISIIIILKKLRNIFRVGIKLQDKQALIVLSILTYLITAGFIFWAISNYSRLKKDPAVVNNYKNITFSDIVKGPRWQSFSGQIVVINDTPNCFRILNISTLNNNSTCYRNSTKVIYSNGNLASSSDFKVGQNILAINEGSGYSSEIIIDSSSSLQVPQFITEGFINYLSDSRKYDGTIHFTLKKNKSSNENSIFIKLDDTTLIINSNGEKADYTNLKDGQNVSVTFSVSSLYKNNYLASKIVINK
jgi:hypothetical protein